MSDSSSRFAWRAMTSVLIAASFAILLLSGAILFVSPPGRIANWTNWSILHLTKRDWTALHIWFSTLFLVVTVIHLIFNWRPMLGYFKDRLTRRLSFRLEWILALGICGGVYVGTRAGVPPFSTLLAFNEQVKESWDQSKERAPIPHAELLTLAELSQKAGIEMSVASNRLAAAGISGSRAEVVVQELANGSSVSAQRIYQIMLGEAAPSGGGSKAGNGSSPGNGGHAGGAGGGPGRKTLSEFCTDEGIQLKDALARLQAKGLKASADLTMREIAVNNGFSRPFELMDIIRGK